MMKIRRWHATLAALLFWMALFPSCLLAQTIQLAPGPSLSSGIEPKNIQSADVDRDGQLDLAVSYVGEFGNPGGVYWYNGPMNGWSSLHTIWTPAPSYQDDFVAPMALDDFNQDGKMDIVGLKKRGIFWIKSIADSSTKTVLDISSYTMGGSTIFSLVTADLNNDGYPDILGGFNHLVWFENGRGSNPIFTMHLISDIYSYQLIVADMDGDGNRDILQGTSNGTMIYWNNGGNPLVFTQDLLTTHHLVTGGIDMDQCGQLDFLGRVSTSTVALYKNAEKNTRKFVCQSPLTDQYLFGYVKVCDLGHDGDLDFAGSYVNKYGTWDLGILENQGGSPQKFQFHALTTLAYPVYEFLFAQTGTSHGWQFAVGVFNLNRYNPHGWVDIKNVVVRYQNGIQDKQWMKYH